MVTKTDKENYNMVVQIEMDKIKGRYPHSDELIFNVVADNKRWGHVIKQPWGIEVEPIGHANTNLLCHTREYDMGFKYRIVDNNNNNIIKTKIITTIKGSVPVYFQMECLH